MDGRLISGSGKIFAPLYTPILHDHVQPYPMPGMAGVIRVFV